MKTILCFGDSNTYGFDGESGGARFTRDVRWTGRLQKILGEGYLVVEEGLNGRTIVHDDPVTGRISGIEYLPACLQSHSPIDLVVFMLGTNDLKTRYCLTPGEIGRASQRAIKLIQDSGCGPDGSPQILLVAPVEGKTTPPNPDWPWESSRFENLPENCRELAKVYEWTAGFMGTYFASLCDQNRFETNNIDGIHLTAKGHESAAKYLSQKITEILKNS